MTREESEIMLRGAGWAAFIDADGKLARRVIWGVFKPKWNNYPRDMWELAGWDKEWAVNWERPSKWKTVSLPENLHTAGTI